jgi:peptidyl-prolyl cis-trans isomerase SurA
MSFFKPRPDACPSSPHKERLVMIKRLFAAAIALAALAAGWPASAQEIDRIAAVVNDDIITNHDLDQRVKMALVLSHLPDTLDVRRRVVPQVLRKMIDETLQTQEAKRLKITLSPQDLNQGVASIERQNHMPPGTLMKQVSDSGLDPSLVRNQIGADLLWYKVVGNVLQPTLHIGDEEINDRLETLKAREGKPEYLVSEIFLPVDNPMQDEQARTLGERLIEQLRQGAPFPVLASQFSQSPTAANGGSLGWVSDGMIDDDLLKAVSSLQPGTITGLVRIGDGYHILGLVNRRIAGSDLGGTDTMLTLSQMTLPLPKNGPPSEALLARAAQLTEGLSSCDAFEAKGRQLGALSVGKIGPTALTALPPPLREAVATLPPGGISQPIQTAPESLQVLMVCARKVAPLSEQALRDRVRRMIEDERIDMMTRRYIRDLRRSAFIDVRM